MAGDKILEGVMAVHKPQGITSADVLRDLQKHFNPSKAFKPWLEEARAQRDQQNQQQRQRRRRREKPIEVKIGHGGTLDPLATGVLITGIGKGTKHLQDFLSCTKSYEAIVTFGAETDTYDRLGKIVRHAPYEHVTRAAVEQALGQFRGKIMQKPPIFSALRVNGKKLYEYAREGKMPPIEIKHRPVETLELEVVEWYEPGTHEYKWPEAEMTGEEKVIAEKLLEQGDAATAAPATEGNEAEAQAADASATKRKEPPVTDEVEDSADAVKKQKVSETEAAPAAAVATESAPAPEPVAPAPATADIPVETAEQPKPQPPAVKIKMTVTSGFYVRSLAHDLGKAVGSCALMNELVRTRQGDYDLIPENIVEYKDLEGGEEVWGPKVERLLTEWAKKQA